MTLLRRLPLIPTILVAAAVATMIALGFWQVSRASEKRELISLYRSNLTKPAMSFPKVGPVPREAMFRLSSVTCLDVVGWRTEGGAPQPVSAVVATLPSAEPEPRARVS